VCVLTPLHLCAKEYGETLAHKKLKQQAHANLVFLGPEEQRQRRQQELVDIQNRYQEMLLKQVYIRDITYAKPLYIQHRYREGYAKPLSRNAPQAGHLAKKEKNEGTRATWGRGVK
jgi:hypothetical protein